MTDIAEKIIAFTEHGGCNLTPAGLGGGHLRIRSNSPTTVNRGTFRRSTGVQWWMKRWSSDTCTSDRLPWQIAAARKLIKEHGRERFAGLDLFEGLP